MSGLNQQARVMAAVMDDLFAIETPSMRWLRDNADAIARIRAEREAEAALSEIQGDVK